MALATDGIWVPDAEYREGAQATALIKHLGLADYDALERLSVEDPETYWRGVIAFCDVRFSKPDTNWCDLTRGEEFPRWFVGAELNWLDSMLDDPARRDRVAVIAENEDGRARQLTYAGLEREVRALVAGLRAQGLTRGDRVGMLLENGIEATVTLMALSHMGAIAVPLFSGFGADAILARLSGCAAKALIMTSGFDRRGRFISMEATLQQVRAAMPELQTVIVKQDPRNPKTLETGLLDWEAVKGDPDTVGRPERMEPMDPFMVIFTSGTTGKPKGVVHTHGGFPLKIASDALVCLDVGPQDVFMWPADMGWIAGSLVMFSALLRGATLVCYDGAPDLPSIGRMAQLVEKYRVTHLGSAPTLIRAMCAKEDEATAADLSSLRILITAGETIAPEHFLWFQRAFGKGRCPLINFTGGTEVSGGLLSNVVLRPIKPGCFNSICPGADIDVINERGERIVGETAELAVKGPFLGMSASFWQDDARYLDSYWAAVPGWWVHGDLVRRDEDGQFNLLGRSDDTLKIAGKRVGPAEVEAILVELPGIAEAAVIGTPDPLKGQAIVAFVTVKGEAEGIETRATQRVAERLGKPFAPKEVIVVKELPKTRSSKIMRRVIRSVYSGAPAGDLSSLVNPEAITDITALLAARGASHGS